MTNVIAFVHGREGTYCKLPSRLSARELDVG